MTRSTTVALAALAALMLTHPAAADSGTEDPALTELVQILRQQGVLDEAEYETIAAKATARAAMQDKQSWYDRIEMWGDFRARYEFFNFFSDVCENQIDSISCNVSHLIRNSHLIKRCFCLLNTLALSNNGHFIFPIKNFLCFLGSIFCAYRKHRNSRRHLRY